MAEDTAAPPSPAASATSTSAATGSGGTIGSSVIPIVNKLQDIFAQLGSASTIELPQVAVVGSQSSGKSSVLEALVGRDFLPRGSEICTRRPLVLQLVHIPPRRSEGNNNSVANEEWGEFLHLPKQRFYDFGEIRREIQAETDREAGGNKRVSDKQIRLKIFSPNVLNITLVDLPGITKVPVGDQPTDIEARIRTMILSYIKHETCIILAVSPANADLANSDALQMARIADPDGKRTIGVITKLDIMDRGTDARNLLLGKTIPLRLGYVGVVNRSQQDINTNRSIKEALAEEERFFHNQPVYHGLAHCCGIPQLAKKLNQILVQHIKNILPALKARINAQLVAVAKEHAAYGTVADSKTSQGIILLQILKKYSEAFSSMIEGKNEALLTDVLSGGARIHYIFQSIFVKSLEEIDPLEDVTDEDIRVALQNATGPRGALFVPEAPFEELVRKLIGHLLDPSVQCARFIYDELVKMSECCLNNELQRYPFLKKKMNEVICNFLRDGLQPAETMITHIIEMEMDYINTSHPNFVGGSKAVEIAHQQVRASRVSTPVQRSRDGNDRAIIGRSGANGILPDHVQGVRPSVDSERLSSSGAAAGPTWGISSIFGSSENRPPARESLTKWSQSNQMIHMENSVSTIQLKEPPATLRPPESQTEQEAVEITITKLLLKSYYDIVRKNIEDSIPKAIMHFLVNHTKRELHNVFIRKLYRENLYEEMLREPDDVAAKRKQILETLRVLQLAQRTLEEIPLEAEMIEKGRDGLDGDSLGLPRVNGLSSSYYANSSYAASPGHHYRSRRSHSGEQQAPPFYQADANGGGSYYPAIDG